jgi:hypothetical protein
MEKLTHRRYTLDYKREAVGFGVFWTEGGCGCEGSWHRVTASGLSSTPGRGVKKFTRRHLNETALLIEIHRVYAEARGPYGWLRVWQQRGN